MQSESKRPRDTSRKSCLRGKTIGKLKIQKVFYYICRIALKGWV